MESAQYLYMDIHSMNGFFNWTMTYRKDSDFYRPYGRIIQVGRNEFVFVLHAILQCGMVKIWSLLGMYILRLPGWHVDLSH